MDSDYAAKSLPLGSSGEARRTISMKSQRGIIERQRRAPVVQSSLKDNITLEMLGTLKTLGMPREFQQP